MRGHVLRILMTSVIMLLLAIPAISQPGIEVTTSAVPFNKTGLPIVTKPFTLKVLSVHENETPPDHNKLALFQQLEAKTGIHVEWVPFNANTADFVQRIQLLMASNDLPDIIRNGLPAQTVFEYGTQGLVIPMEKLVDTYAPYVVDTFKAVPQYKTSCMAPDGHMYGLGKLPPLGADCQAMPFTNKTWLDKLGLKMPETSEDFYTVLRAFKEKDPNGNGKADEIPLSAVFYSKNLFSSDLPFTGMFGLPGNRLNNWLLRDNNGRPQLWFATEAFKKYVSYMNRLYAEGLVDQEIYTQDRAALVAKGNQDPAILGCVVSWFAATNLSTAIASQYTAMKVPKGSPDGGYYPWLSNKFVEGGYAFAITKKCQSPEIAMRWINEMCEPVFNLQLNSGPIGIILKQIDAKTFSTNSPPAGQNEATWKNSLSLGGSSIFTWRESFNLVGSGTIEDTHGRITDRPYFYFGIRL